MIMIMIQSHAPLEIRSTADVNGGGACAQLCLSRVRDGVSKQSLSSLEAVALVSLFLSSRCRHGVVHDPSPVGILLPPPHKRV